MTKEIQFFLPMQIPSKTAQEKKIAVRNGRPVLYTPKELVEIRTRYVALLAPHAPPEPMTKAVMLHTMWIYPAGGSHREGDYKVTKPDTDNLLKLFKDAMTDAGFWKDDAQVAMELTDKRYGPHEGVYVRVMELEGEES